MKKILVLSAIISIFSCADVPDVMPDIDIQTSERVILIEELTGVNCPNCPNGSAELENLIQLHDQKVIGVSVHGEFLAQPLSESAYDFRSDVANDLENKLKPFFGKPGALINRVQREGQPEYSVSNVSLWSQYAEEELSKPVQLTINLGTTFNEDTRALVINAALNPKVDLSGDLRINVMITESHIWDAQKFPTSVEENYEHNHMLRTMLTSLDGDALGVDLTVDNVVDREFTFTIPEDPNLWVPENMDVIVFISQVDGSSEQVIQAAKVQVIN